jgi:hypothetical protein
VRDDARRADQPRLYGRPRQVQGYEGVGERRSLRAQGGGEVGAPQQDEVPIAS